MYCKLWLWIVYKLINFVVRCLQQLQQEVFQAQQMALSLDDRLQESTDSVDLLSQFSHRYALKFSQMGLNQQTLVIYSWIKRNFNE